MRQVTLKAPKIHCDGWVYSLRMAVRLVKGVQKVNGDAKAKTLTIDFDPQMTSVETIKKAMARAGYDASEVWSKVLEESLIQEWFTNLRPTIIPQANLEQAKQLPGADTAPTG